MEARSDFDDSIALVVARNSEEKIAIF